MRGTYFENSGYPRDEERGVYCPHGEKIVEFYNIVANDQPDNPQVGRLVEPWPCERIGCTREAFQEATVKMEADLEEAAEHAWGCTLAPGHEQSCEGDRGDL